jgi:hypothetical protein
MHTFTSCTMKKQSAKLQTLDEAFHLQGLTIETLKNINDDLVETEEVGRLTLESLKREKYKLNDILEESDRLNRAHDETRRLHNRLGRWTMNFSGLSRKGVRKNTSSKGGKLRKGGEASSQIRSSFNRSNAPTKQGTASQYYNKATDNSFHGTGICSADSILRETHGDEMKELDENDKVIERMLNDTSAILAGFESLNIQVAGEIASSGEDLQVIEKQLEAAESNLQRINARSLDFLYGRSLQKGMNVTGRSP